MHRAAATTLLVLALAGPGGCAGGPPAQGNGTQGAPVRPLAGLAAQRIVVAPVSAVSEGDPMSWAASIPRQRDWLRQLDRAITAELGARGLDRGWVFPEALLRSYERNPALSPDPYRLATDPLRGMTKVTGDQRIPDPLASQLRTLVAMHDARFVLLPVRVGFEPRPDVGGRAVMKLLLVDARTSEVAWIGEVRSDAFPTFDPGVATSLATQFADLIAAR